MTHLDGSLPAVVITASPVGHPPFSALMASHSIIISGPPSRWIAPSTPPPPTRREFAALTIASVSCRVMSPCRSLRTLPAILISFMRHHYACCPLGTRCGSVICPSPLSERLCREFPGDAVPPSYPATETVCYRFFSIQPLSSSIGVSPTSMSAGVPFLNEITAGMLLTPNMAAVLGSLFTSIL